MPLFTGHGVAGLISAYYFNKERPGSWEVLCCVLAANLPDLDYIPGFLAGTPKRFHPSFTHSFLAFIMFSTIVYGIAKSLRSINSRRWTLILSTAYASHLVLDIIQNDNYTANGVGIPLFYPLSRKCYQTGWNWLPSISNFMDFTSFSSTIRSIFSPEILRYLLHEQLVLGGIIVFVFALRWVWNHKVINTCNIRKTTN